MADDVHQWTIGDVTVTRVPEMVVELPPEMLLPDCTAAHLEGADWLAPWFPGGQLALSFHTYVIRSAGRTIVVDTCLGDDGGGHVPGDLGFPDRLDAAVDGGLGAVDMVMCTHLHFDHVGWNTRRDGPDGALVPTFPNARYLFARTEHETYGHDDPHGIVAARVRPLFDAGLVEIVDDDAALTPEVRLRPTVGHTPGHVSVAIESGGAGGLITGDAFHAPVQFRYPELTASNYDWDSARAIETRRALVAEHADSGVLVLGTHFAPPSAGRLRRAASGEVWFEGVAPA